MFSLKLLILIIILSTILTGCSLNLNSQTKDAGVFKSFDYAENWQQKNFAGKSQNKEFSISGIETREIVFDPKNHLNVFLASRSNGLFVSENGGEEWRQILSSGFVSSVACDFNNQGVVYAAVSNKVYKTIDMGRNWKEIYLESRAETQIMQVVIDPKDTSKLIIGSSNGEILISSDGGENWYLVAELKDTVRKILINPKNPNTIYAGTLKNGIYKSTDGGKNWKNLKENYLSISRQNSEYRVLILNPKLDDGLIFATRYGIIKSDDGGRSWKSLNLLTPPSAVYINALAVNPQNTDHIYYATQNAIFRSFDAGKTWLNMRLPTSNSPIYLAVDPETTNVVYMGVMKLKKKPFFFL